MESQQGARAKSAEDSITVDTHSAALGPWMERIEKASGRSPSWRNSYIRDKVEPFRAESNMH
jgi:hypothetical protein